MDCLFCRIIDGALPATVVLDEPFTLGFLDTRPVFKGHVLLVPKIHVDTLVDLPARAAARADGGGPARVGRRGGRARVRRGRSSR